MTATESADAAVDLVTVGESMVAFSPTEPVPLADATSVSMHVGGAESNVASYVSDLGFRVRWSSLLGEDPFAQIILRDLNNCGVDTESVVQVAGGHTGIYVKDVVSSSGTAVHYFRSGSAATQLSTTHMQHDSLRHSKILHLSGVTAALSPSAQEMVIAAATERTDPSRLVSFDVNFRPRLWSAEIAGRTLMQIANNCDIVFVGLDEAHALWGTETVADIRALLPEPETVVVKDGAVGAYAVTTTGTEFVSSPHVRVVELVGAGDAFAGGYLAAALAGWSVQRRLRLGHLIAARALSVTSDYVKIPRIQDFSELCALPDDSWQELRLPHTDIPRPGDNGVRIRT